MEVEKDISEEISSNSRETVLSFSNEELEEVDQESRLFRQHFNATVEMFGDKSTLTQVVILLACVRSLIQEKRPAELKLSIGKHLVSTDEFTFSVNGQEISQLKVDSGSTLEIN